MRRHSVCLHIILMTGGFMKRLLLTATCLLWATSAQAHDFWLQPATFKMDAPSEVALAIRIGHAQDQTYWASDPDRVTSFRHFSAEGTLDIQSSIPAGGKNISVPVEASGFHMLAIETTHAFSELPATAFNAYLKEEGLTSIMSARKDAKTQAEAGREIYSRRGKSLMLVGDVPEAAPDFVAKPLGMTLEIVANPYRANADGEIEATVFYRGLPLEGAQIVFVSLDTMAGDIAAKISDEDGLVSFRKPSAGQWMIHAVWSDPIEDHPMGDFDTTFSSLSFGY